MKRVICLLLSVILLLGLLPTALAEGGEGTGEKLEYGEPVGFTVEIEGEKRICFMGVGQLINGKYDLLSGTTMGWSQHQPGSLHVAVGLWWLKDFGGGNYDWIALTSDEVDAVTEQVGPFSLEIIPDSGQITKPDAQNETDANAPKMPCQCYYELVKEHRGDWILKASCTVKDKTLTAYGAATLTVMKDIILTSEQSDTVEKINGALKSEIEGITEPGSYTITAFLTKTGETEQDAYCGRIEIPNSPKPGVDIWVQIQGVGQGQNAGVENTPVTLFGGIYSDTIPFSVSGVNFVGAGKGKTNWPKDGPNKGNANVAFDGNSMSNVSNCTFTGYDIAIKCGTSLRMFGRYNTFTENHIAWKLSEACKGDGNPDAQSCVFEKNDYALYVEKFNGFPSSYAPRYCRFIDNVCDVYNGSGRWWFLPGNYFEHNRNKRPVYGATSVFCYPMATREGTNGQEENNPVTYYYDQLDKDGDTVSNALTNTYQTPKSELSGKTFKVADTVMVAGTEKDTVLATFSFPEETETATQALAAPAIALFAAEPVVQETPKSFDATVTVDRSDASKIEFTMQDPCKQVNVSLPCSFTDGTVKLGETEILDAKFDGQTVSFQTDEAGTYVIESKTPVQPKPDDAITGSISGIVASGALQPGASASQFADLTAGSWYYGGVRYALENGLMTGTSARTFAPDRPVTRAMLVTILWRLAGEPYGRVSPFEDVLPGSWYAQAVSWTYDKGIVTGVTATSFQPGAPVTREQLCAILCRYAALTGKNTAASASLDAFTDRAQVSAYAEASVRWALQAGLLTGVGDGRLAPRSGATRAQLAILLQRFAGLK